MVTDVFAVGLPTLLLHASLDGFDEGHQYFTLAQTSHCSLTALFKTGGKKSETELSASVLKKDFVQNDFVSVMRYYEH